MINLDQQVLGFTNPSKARSHSQPYTHTHTLSRSLAQFQFASSSSSPENGTAYLRPDLTKTSGVVTNICSPFRDWREAVEGKEQGGIKVQKTIEISRVEDSHENSSESASRPRTVKSVGFGVRA